MSDNNFTVKITGGTPDLQQSFSLALLGNGCLKKSMRQGNDLIIPANTLFPDPFIQLDTAHKIAKDSVGLRVLDIAQSAISLTMAGGKTEMVFTLN